MVKMVKKCCPTLLEIVGLRVPIRNIQDFTLYSVDPKRRICLAECVSAAISIKTEGVF